MNISLSPATLKIIEERMKNGGYATAEDVVLAGLSSLEEQENAIQFEPGQLKRLLAAGEASGEPLNGEQVLDELRSLREQSGEK